MVDLVYNYISSDTSLDGAMIEGIIGLFVILFLILVVPYIKDWYDKNHGVQDDFVGNIILERNGVQYKFNIEYGEEFPPNPNLFQKFLNTKDNMVYNYDGEQWLKFVGFEGDLWLW